VRPEMSSHSLPTYRELPEAPGMDGRHAWGVFGAGDQLGRINLLTDAVVASAAGEVQLGQTFNLTLPLHEPNPPWSKGRGSFTHHIFSVGRNSQDDYLDGFYLQGSTQWDGLRHIAARDLGFWGGTSVEDAGPLGDKLGIENWAQHGIIGRGVLVDVGRYLSALGAPLDCRQGITIGVDLLTEVLSAQRTSLQSGDILLLRTGYIDGYLAADAATRADYSIRRDCPGLSGGEAMAEFLWDSGVVAIATDNPAVEVVPGDPAAGSLHRRLIPLLGFALGELFVLGSLADSCEKDGRYTCLFVGVPLNLNGGVGSPANSVAMR
jgi:kynurenine formamidase